MTSAPGEHGPAADRQESVGSGNQRYGRWLWPGVPQWMVASRPSGYGGRHSPCPAGLTLQAGEREVASFQGLPSPQFIAQAVAWVPDADGSLLGRCQHIRNGSDTRSGGTANRFLEADAGAFSRLQVRPGVFFTPCRGASARFVWAWHGHHAGIRGPAPVAPCTPCYRPVTAPEAATLRSGTETSPLNDRSLQNVTAPALARILRLRVRSPGKSSPHRQQEEAGCIPIASARSKQDACPSRRNSKGAECGLVCILQVGPLARVRRPDCRIATGS